MIVLGGVKVNLLVHLATIVGLGTIILCYCIALALGHVKLWPVPMISDCAVSPPEKYPFRLGIVTAAWLMALENVFIFLAGVPRSKIALGLGLVACLGLGVVGVVNEKEASKVHSSELSNLMSPTHQFCVVLQVMCR